MNPHHRCVLPILCPLNGLEHDHITEFPWHCFKNYIRLSVRTRHLTHREVIHYIQIEVRVQPVSRCSPGMTRGSATNTLCCQVCHEWRNHIRVYALTQLDCVTP
jgi:hypothetical protein